MFDQEKVKSLKELELHLLEYVYKNYDLVPYLKIRDLANNANVSTGTVLRFCKKLGYDGYSDFRFVIKNALNNNTSPLSTTTHHDIIKFINEANSGHFEKKLCDVAAIVNQADYIAFVGVGNSGAAALYGEKLFSNANKIATSFTDGYRRMIVKNSLSKVAILISVSGEIPEMIEYIERFKRANYTIISICNSENCTLARLSDETLCYHMTPINRSHYVDCSTQIPVFYVIEKLVHYIENNL